MQQVTYPALVTEYPVMYVVTAADIPPSDDGPATDDAAEVVDSFDSLSAFLARLRLTVPTASGASDDDSGSAPFDDETPAPLKEASPVVTDEPVIETPAASGAGDLLLSQMLAAGYTLELDPTRTTTGVRMTRADSGGICSGPFGTLTFTKNI